MAKPAEERWRDWHICVGATGGYAFAESAGFTLALTHRDEGFLSRAQFEVQTPQIVRVVDGGPEVMQMLAIGSAGELLAMRNRFALSASDAAHALCADLGCQPAPYAPAVHPRPQPAQPPAAVPAREGVFRKFRKEKRGEQVVCPF